MGQTLTYSPAQLRTPAAKVIQWLVCGHSESVQRHNVTAEIERRKKKKEIREKRERDEAAEPPTPARDDNGLILLPDADYNQLCEELGESELSRVVSYQSGYCHLHGKSYPDWPFAIRKASKEGWGKPAPGKGTASVADFQPSADRIRKNHEWLDGFLAEQAKKEGSGKWDNLPGVTRL